MTSPAQTRTLVCFDLGGVLVRICRSLREACERSSIPYRNASWLDADEARAARKAVMDAYQVGALSTARYYEELSRALGPEYCPAEAQAIHEAWTIEEYPGVDALLGSLSSSPNILTACLSNTNERHWQMLFGESAHAVYPSLPLLGTRLASHELGVAKPDPNIFRVAAAQFRAALGEESTRIVFFDDLQPNVDAARAAGWDAICIDPLADTASQIRDALALRRFR